MSRFNSVLREETPEGIEHSIINGEGDSTLRRSLASVLTQINTHSCEITCTAHSYKVEVNGEKYLGRAYPLFGGAVSANPHIFHEVHRKDGGLVGYVQHPADIINVANTLMDEDKMKGICRPEMPELRLGREINTEIEL